MVGLFVLRRLSSLPKDNLFDGVPGISFFGYFSDLDATEVVARVRFLLNNIDLSYRRLLPGHHDPAQHDAALRILDQLHVEVLVPEDAPVDEIKKKIEEYRPEGSSIEVAVHKPSEIERVVQDEYESMGLRR